MGTVSEVEMEVLALTPQAFSYTARFEDSGIKPWYPQRNNYCI